MRRCVAATTVLAAVGVLAGPAAAADGAHAPYVFDLRAAAGEVELDVYDGWTLAPGYSGVRLDTSTLGSDRPFCEAAAGGVYDHGVIEDRTWTDHLPPRPPLAATVSAAGAAPASPGDGGGLFNPTLARDTAPNLSPGENLNARRPRLRNPMDASPVLDVPSDGNGVRWQAACADGSSGQATAANGDTTAGALGAAGLGSATTARVDPATGIYTGTARAFIAGLRTPGGVIDLITSVVRIRQVPGREPSISYRIGVTGGPVIAGLDVPASDLTAQFTALTADPGFDLTVFDAYGLTLIGPTHTPTVRTAPSCTHPCSSWPPAQPPTPTSATPTGSGSSASRSPARLPSTDSP